MNLVVTVALVSATTSGDSDDRYRISPVRPSEYAAHGGPVELTFDAVVQSLLPSYWRLDTVSLETFVESELDYGLRHTRIAGATPPGLGRRGTGAVVHECGGTPEPAV